MADREAILGVLEETRSRFLEADVQKHFAGWSRTMEYHFTDTDEYFTLVIRDGKPDAVVPGKAEKAEIRYEMATDTFVAITHKELSAMKAYTQGKIKVKAPMPDLLKLQKIS